MKGIKFTLSSPISKENGEKLKEDIEKERYIYCTDLEGNEVKVKIQ